MNSRQQIHDLASIHPTVVMEGDIKIGANTSIGPYCVIKGPLEIGENNQISGNVMLGIDPGHKTMPAKGRVLIGSNNVIREFSVVQRGIGELETTIQNNCYILPYTSIAHDSLIEDDVIIASKTALAGHCHVLRGAILGLGVLVKEMTTIGSYAFAAMGSVITKDVPPFCLVKGNPARFYRFNSHALKQLNNLVTLEDLQICNGLLQSNNIIVQNCIAQFDKHSRSKIIALTT